MSWWGRCGGHQDFEKSRDVHPQQSGADGETRFSVPNEHDRILEGQRPDGDTLVLEAKWEARLE